jgi:hypothetical protein
MPLEIREADDIAGLEEQARTFAGEPLIDVRVLSVADVLALPSIEASMLVDGVVPAIGASLIVGAAKSGKTLFASQLAIAVASGSDLCGYFRVLAPGPVLIVEQDDPAGAGSIKTIFQRSRVPVSTELPLHLAPRVPFEFGPALIEWLETQITKLSLRLVVLDSYTALRGSRPRGIDIVKAEAMDLSELDALAKRTASSILVIHHASKGSSALDWTQAAAGTFAMSAATESQIHIQRFAEVENNTPERLVRIRGRHFEDLEMVIRFCKDTLDFDFVLKGGASSLYPTLIQIKAAFGENSFSPKELSHATGWSRATAHRQIDRLHRAGALDKHGHGSYRVAAQ